MFFRQILADRRQADTASRQFPACSITAYSALHGRAHVQPEDRVLVLGASGGVGAMAVQLAKIAGATVWGHTGSAAKADGIIANGAGNVVVGTAWQTTLVALPIFIVIHETTSMLVTLGVLVVTSVILKLNWWNKLDEISDVDDEIAARGDVRANPAVPHTPVGAQ